MEELSKNPEAAGEPEREPQPHDVVAACREVLKRLAPEVHEADIEDNLLLIEAATDLEEALGNAAAFFAYFDVDYDQALQLLGEILQVERIEPNGDRIREAEEREE